MSTQQARPFTTEVQTGVEEKFTEYIQQQYGEPRSRSDPRVMEYFQDVPGMNLNLIMMARKLRETKGILSDPPTKRGKPLSDETKQAVVEFYEDDKFSRMCPGQNDSVSIRNADGTKEIRQKRMLLANLKEIHLEFKKRHPDLKIGFSSFCALRPKWCVTVDSAGTHNVCV